MSDHSLVDLSQDPHVDEPAITDFERLISRRAFLGGAIGIGTAALAMGATALASASARAASRLGFTQVATNTLDTITVPPGYRWQVVVKWGDPLWSNAPEFDDATRGTGASQERAFGDNNDGMALFANDGKLILAVNNEYVNTDIMFGNRASSEPETADDVRKSKAGHGISVVEVSQTDGVWHIVKDSPFNRRITADTPMEITGPARGHDP